MPASGTKGVHRTHVTRSGARARVSLVLLLFAATLFVSSALLFLVQPMFAKMVLPLLGGTPAVWNTCMVFFQAALLAGYAYAHALPTLLGTRKSLALHLLLLALPVLVLPIALPFGWLPPRDSNPVFWLLAVLAVAVGLPFLVVSTTAPLVQRWFAGTDHASADDPYFLYGASNLGSMLALLAYPIILEPFFSLGQHTRLWTVGYFLYLMLMLGCALFVWRNSRLTDHHSLRAPTNQKLPAAANELTRARCLRWVLLAFIPSSLMLSVTSYLTTDIAAIPLLWVVPLAIYLLSFVLVFARRPPIPYRLPALAMPRVILLLTLVMLSEATEPIWLLLFVHLLTFFVVAVACHGELARDRPLPRHLTTFYLLLSLGGVLGGLFNALVAPLIFSGVVEYPVVLILACFLGPLSAPLHSSPRTGGRWPSLVWPVRTRAGNYDLVAPLILGAGTAILVIALQAAGLEPGMRSIAFMFGLPVLVCYTFIGRPLRFGLGIATLLLASLFYHGVRGTVLYRERTFFGVHRVTESADGKTHQLVHGNTVHGRQNPRHAREPLSYYFRAGPIGQVFHAFSGTAAKPAVAIVGLGAGSLAAYGESGQHFTFYEIDPAVVRVAETPDFFTYLRDSQAKIDIVLGDARLTLHDAPANAFGILVIDAFSSDSIPLHLLTREALELYLSKLAEHGILAFNISNRYLVLEPVLAALAEDAKIVCLDQDMTERDLSAEDMNDGKFPSEWVIMARRRDDLGPLLRSSRWRPAKSRGDVAVWTDNFSNLFRVFRWN
jgi:hypothetical protein